MCTKVDEIKYEDSNIHCRLRWLSLDLSGSACCIRAAPHLRGAPYRPRQQSHSRRRAPFSSSAQLTSS